VVVLADMSVFVPLTVHRVLLELFVLLVQVVEHEVVVALVVRAELGELLAVLALMAIDQVFRVVLAVAVVKPLVELLLLLGLQQEQDTGVLANVNLCYS
jgi:hypothetical protein